MKHEILIYNKTKRRVPEKLIKLIISGALKFLKLKQPVELAVLVLNRADIKRLNKIWRGKNNVPDELSFGYNSRQTVEFAEGYSNMVSLGEIAVNVDGIFNRKHLSKILVHALMHLLGRHHEKSAAEAKKIERLEERILKHLVI
ncbi:MAG: rRNA maturation RNase YbeY [bacterium]|nr:rRNA maturation RNase YbeY [bacterium]